MTTIVEPREHVLETRGLRFHYVEWGEAGAPAIVLLHGLSAMCRIWDHLALAFHGRYRLIAIDQRGHGDTSWPEEAEYTTDAYVGDLEAIVAALELQRLALVGLSMGAMNSIAYASRNPERVTHLVSVDIRPSIDREADAADRGRTKRVAEDGHPTFASEDEAFEARKATHPHTPDASTRHHVRHLLKRLADGRWTFKHDPRVSYRWRPANLWDELPKVQAPVLIVRGGQSAVLPEKTAVSMREAFPKAELVTIEEAGHTIPEDAPERFNQAVAEFLERYSA